MLLSEFLIKARAKIDTPEKWIQGDYARNAQGKYVMLHSPTATCFCTMGAIRRTIREEFPDSTVMGSRGDFGNFTQPLFKTMGNWVSPDETHESAIETFNDHHTHAELMSVFNSAIEWAKENDKELA